MALGGLGRLAAEFLGRLVQPSDVGIGYAMVGAYLNEAMAPPHNGYLSVRLEDMESGQAILACSPEEQVLVLRAAFARHDFLFGRTSSTDQRPEVLRKLSSRLLRKRLPYKTDDLTALTRAVTGQAKYVNGLPLLGLVRAIEFQAERDSLTYSLRRSLEDLRREVQACNGGADGSIGERIARLLEGPVPQPLLKDGPWGVQVRQWLLRREPEEQQEWTALLAHAGTAGKRNRPPKAWLKQAATLVDSIGQDRFREQLGQWLEWLKLDPLDPDPDNELVRGLIWAGSGLRSEGTAKFFGDFAERCFVKAYLGGARSISLGNAAFFALGALPEHAGVTQLLRLRRKVKYPSARQQIDKVLQTAAKRSRVTQGQLEERWIPTFGFDREGRRINRLGEYRVRMHVLDPGQVTVTWLDPDGGASDRIPERLRRRHHEEVRRVLHEVREIRDNLIGQRARLETLFVAERLWSFADWRQFYLEHPLLSAYCRRLIWRFTAGEKTSDGILEGDLFVDQSGRTITWLDDETKVSLWHPIHSPADQVLAWRRRLSAIEVTQPFKQAHREIYVLTEAERASGIYSNRFAAHLLKQSKFSALCRRMGWRNEVQGDQIFLAVPERKLPEIGMTAQFWVDSVESVAGDDRWYLYIATDQVRVLGPDREALPLTEIPPLVFSEVMRDVEVFVDVAGVGSDLTWQDRGADLNEREYWWQVSFGELGQNAKTRRAILKDILPKLKLADRCRVGERFLEVRGNRCTYKIHLGSANILMEPNDQHLCIAMDRSQKSAKQIWLPFEGDARLSIILSKAFMLVDDDKITDPTILSQIRH